MKQGTEPELRRHILGTARRLLTSDGYAALSMRRIAREIGYSATSIYLHYDDKDQLVHALIDEGVELLYTRLSVVPAEVSPPDRLTRLCRAYIDFGREMPEYYEIMYWLHTEYIERYPAEKYRKARQNLNFFADVLEEGATRGLFDETEPLLGATAIWSQMHGVVSLINSQRVDRKLNPDTLVLDVIRRIVRGCLRDRGGATPTSSENEKQKEKRNGGQ